MQLLKLRTELMVSAGGNNKVLIDICNNRSLVVRVLQLKQSVPGDLLGHGLLVGRQEQKYSV
jgi:hypothetical protein